jgi:hypothetical protein
VAGLLEPYIPNFGDFARSATQGYALGDTMRRRDVSVEAGGLAAKGNMRGARDALYRGGEIDDGFKVDDRMIASTRAAKTEQLEQAAKVQGMIGNLAMMADTPEKWGKAIETAKNMGLDVRKYADFSARDVALAQTGKVTEFLKMELDRRKQTQEEQKPIEVNGRLVRPRVGGGSYEEVYTAPPKPEGLRDVAPGSTVFDPNTRQPVFTAPEKPQPLQSVGPGQTLYDPNKRETLLAVPEKPQATYDFTKTGVGNKFTGDFKPYEPGQGDDPEVTLERGKYEQGLRKEYTQITGDLRTINDSYARMKSASAVNSGAGDIAVVYSYMKMLDPTSVVREGEYATAENTGGIPEKITNVYNKIISGQRLTPEQRRQFLESGEVIAKDKVERFGKTRSQFENIAKSSGADPGRIMLDEGMAQAAPKQGGTTTRIDLGGGGGGALPDEAVRMLRGNPSPEMRRYFDETFGTGASQRALGR